MAKLGRDGRQFSMQARRRSGGARGSFRIAVPARRLSLPCTPRRSGRGSRRRGQQVLTDLQLPVDAVEEISGGVREPAGEDSGQAGSPVPASFFGILSGCMSLILIANTGASFQAHAMFFACSVEESCCNRSSNITSPRGTRALRKSAPAGVPRGPS